MKRENDKDALEQLFQKYLSEETAGKQGWNTPSDDLLFAALDKVDPPVRKKRPFPWFWTLLGLLLVLSATLFYQTSLRLDHLDQEINLLHEKVKLEAPSKDANQVEKIPESKSLIIEKTGPRAKGDISSQPLNISSTTNIPPNSSNINQAEKAIVINQENAVPAVKTLPDQVDREEFTFEIQEAIAPLYLNPEPPISGSPNDLKIKAYATLPAPAEEIEVLSRKGRTHIFAGTILSSLRMNGAAGSANPELFGYDKQRLGFTAGIGFERPIGKKLATRHSLSYATFSNKSYYQEEWTFKANKIGVDANGENWYDAADKPVFTPLGATAQQTPMAMTDIVPDNLDLLETRTDVKQEFHLIELRTGLRYQLLANKKWQVTLDGDFEMKYVLGFHEWANIDVTQEKQLIMNNELNSNSKENLNELLFGVSANMNLEYQWTDRIFSSMELGAFQPLNSISKENDGIETYLNRFKFGLVTGFRF